MINKLYSENERNFYVRESVDSLWSLASCTNDHRIKAEIYKYFIKLFSENCLIVGENIDPDTMKEIEAKFYGITD